METVKSILACMALLCSTELFGQGNNTSFHTIREHEHYNHTTSVANMHEVESTIQVDSLQFVDSLQLNMTDFSDLSIEQLEKLISLYEEYISHNREGRNTKKCRNGRIISYYNGNCHELNITNLKSVIEEVGLSNQLFVLAQAILETGNFTSHVCKNYHNLFGLYDSKNGDYYRFARWEDSVVGYQKFIQYRYKGGNYLQFLKRIGYAEDPRYENKVAQIATQIYKNLINNH